MKAVPIREAQKQLGELVLQACRGERIVLTDGEHRVVLEPDIPLELEEDSLELEAELLKGVDGPFAPYSAEEMKTVGERVLRERRAQ